MILTKKEYNEVRAERERCGHKVKSWISADGRGLQKYFLVAQFSACTAHRLTALLPITVTASITQTKEDHSSALAASGGWPAVFGQICPPTRQYHLTLW